MLFYKDNNMEYLENLKKCNLCPHKCGVNRIEGKKGMERPLLESGEEEKKQKEILGSGKKKRDPKL